MAQFHMCMQRDWFEEWNLMGFRDTIHAYGRASSYLSELYTMGRVLAGRLEEPEDTSSLASGACSFCHWERRTSQVPRSLTIHSISDEALV